MHAASVPGPPLSGLRVQRCHKLQHRSQMQLRSGIAVAVVWAGSCRSSSTPSLGTSICLGSGHSEKRRRGKEKKRREGKKREKKRKRRKDLERRALQHHLLNLWTQRLLQLEPLCGLLSFASQTSPFSADGLLELLSQPIQVLMEQKFRRLNGQSINQTIR